MQHQMRAGRQNLLFQSKEAAKTLFEPEGKRVSERGSISKDGKTKERHAPRSTSTGRWPLKNIFEKKGFEEGGQHIHGGSWGNHILGAIEKIEKRYRGQPP